MKNAQNFTAEYFLKSHISNYNDYTAKKFDKLCRDLVVGCNIQYKDYIVDFGCATGGLLSEFKNKGFRYLKGTDISNWAISFGQKEYGLINELEYFNSNLLWAEKDWLIMLDVLEHIDTPELGSVLDLISQSNIKKGIILRIPVSAQEGKNFVLDVSKNDRTHIQIHSKKFWEQLFEGIGFTTKKVLAEETIYESEGVMARWMVKKNE